MDLIKILVGLVLTIIGGKGVWWIVGMILGGVTSGNLVMVVAGGILSYLLLGLLFVALLAGLALLTEGVFE